MLEIAEPGAAILLLGGDAEHAERAELAPEIGREVVHAVDLRRARRDLIGGEPPHLLAQRLRGLAESEVEGRQAVGDHGGVSIRGAVVRRYPCRDCRRSTLRTASP